MQTLAIANTIHGYFLAPKHISAEGDESESEAEEETDDDDYDLELGGQNLSSGDSDGISVSRVRLQKTTGRVCSVSYCIFFVLNVCSYSASDTSHAYIYCCAEAISAHCTVLYLLLPYGKKIQN